MYLATERIIFLFPARFVYNNKVSNDACKRVLIENLLNSSSASQDVPCISKGALGTLNSWKRQYVLNEQTLKYVVYIKQPYRRSLLS